MLYAVKKDDDCSGLLIVFGTEEEIIEGTLCGGMQAACSEFEELQDELQDTCELCEGYLIVSERFTEEGQIPEVRAIVEARGFVEDYGLLNCGWG